MKIIITMAGRSSRFFKAGYTIPKFKIEINKKSMFEWAILSLKSFFIHKFIFITLREHQCKSFVVDKCNLLGITQFEIIELDEVTDGQATTVLKAEDFVSKDEEIVIYNIDTYVKEGILDSNAIDGEGWIPVFFAEGTHWSFVKMNEQLEVSQVLEKQRISDYGTIGLYYFRKFNYFLSAYNDIYKNSNVERYIAPMYNWMIKKNLKIKAFIIDPIFLYPLGTPDEVAETLKRLL